jgi:hypothetical protein
MSNRKLYLKDDVYFEPLFNGWYAWSYLVPPVHAARYVVNTHRRIMKSFVNNYELHISALKESVVTGGEFLNCTADQVGVINGLIEDIDNRCRDIVQLSDAVTRLDEMLAQHTTGQSIEYLYERVPPELRGFVELVMDLQHRPSYRLIEPLLYRSKYYKPHLQKLSFGSLSRVDERPFCLSTPRLPDDNHLHVNLDFSSPLADEIFSARETPLEERRIAEIFEGVEKKGGLGYQDLFTESKSAYPRRHVNGGVRLEYTGHAGFLVENRNCAVLIDPVIASRGAGYADEVFGFSQLPARIDYICLTHNHQDHVNLETLLQLRYKTKHVLVPKNNGGTLADPSIKLLLKQLGFCVTEVDDLEEIPLPNGRITRQEMLLRRGFRQPGHLALREPARRAVGPRRVRDRHGMRGRAVHVAVRSAAHEDGAQGHPRLAPAQWLGLEAGAADHQDAAARSRVHLRARPGALVQIFHGSRVRRELGADPRVQQDDRGGA